MKKVLGIFAHPDDESIDAGGTLAKYVKSGWKADLVVATRGEAGVWGDVEENPGESLGEVRSSELEEAAGILGIRSITYLDYKDGTLPATTPGDIEDKLVGVLEELKPDAVITHEPGGLTNHPDHVKLSYAATFAFQRYAQTLENENPDAINPPKLYFACFPESILTYLTRQKLFPEEMHGKPILGVDDKRITTVIDIKRFASQKVQAFDAHRTQREHLTKYVNIPRSPFFVNEYFILRLTGTTEVFMGKNDRVSDRL